MSTVRPFQADDANAVAQMFHKMLGRGKGRPSPELAPYFVRLFLEAPGFDPDIASQVHLTDDGTISGFIGVSTLPMTLNGQSLRAGICGTLMVEDHDSDPMAGARLMRAFLAGPQDLSLSETASDVAGQMWTRLRGTVLPQYSLEWIRVLKPAAFALDTGAARFRALKLFSPLASATDFCVKKSLRGDGPHWVGNGMAPPQHQGLDVVSVSPSEFAGLYEPLTAQFSLRPRWTYDQLIFLINDALMKPVYGTAVMAAVRKGNTTLGAYLYHFRENGVARVLQVFARPGQAGPVLDCLFADAAERGAAGLRGRTQPALLEAMFSRKIVFAHSSATVLHSANTDCLDAFARSEGFFNGLAGEQWCRLFGGGLS